MNVLVYTGPEVIQTSFTNALSSLRSILLSTYVIQPIEHIALAKQPWHTSCALLVFPRLRQPFTAPASTQIQDYVDRGGAFLALGTGARSEIRAGVTAGIADAMAGLSLDKIRFYDKFNNAYIIPTVPASSHGEGRLASLKSVDGDIIHAVYESLPQGDFTSFKRERGIKILGRYLSEESTAGVGCDIGRGRIALWSPALEQPISSSPVSTLLSASQESNIIDLDRERLRLLQRTLLYLGLHLPASSSTSQNDNENAPIARPFPQSLVCSPERPDVVDRIVASLSDAFESSEDDKPKIIKDSNDTLSFHSSVDSSTQTLLESSKNLLKTPSDPSTWQPKHIIIHRHGALPSPTYTQPYFDLSLFFQHLNSARPASSPPAVQTGDSLTWPLGTALFFTPSITSTQTLLDKNPKYLSSLPTPTVHIASYQLLARGRGSNAWLSPAGSLSKSVHLRLPPATDVPSSKLVFVQYLYAMAVCQGVRDDSVLGGDNGEGWRVRIKWPNDVYALVGPKGGKESEMEKKKIGGILVSMNFGAGGTDIIIGCGLNVFNDQPMTSLLQLLRQTSPRRANLSLERTAAVILARFESLWTKFVDSKGSFEPFLDDYLQLWLHSDQPVLLTTTNPPTPVRITSITLDHGLLRTIPERPTLSSNPYIASSSSRKGKEEYIDLQPDGNSFDLMAGLIRSKQ